MEMNILSKSIDNNTGMGRMTIEGQLPVPQEFDDPIVELFRPVRAKHKNKVLFTILVARKSDCIVCTFVPSNNANISEETFLNEATKILPDIIEEYNAVLDLFFSEKTGLKQFVKNAEKADYVQGNETIKSFVAELGLKMPSIKEELKKLSVERGKKKASKKTKKPAK